VEGEAAAADVDGVEEVGAEAPGGVGVDVPVFDDMGKAGADDAGDEGDHAGVDEGFGVKLDAPREELGQLEGEEEADDEHGAVAVEREVEAGDAEDFWVHAF